MDYIVELIDRVLCDPENEENIASVRKDVNALMADYPLFRLVTDKSPFLPSLPFREGRLS